MSTPYGTKTGYTGTRAGVPYDAAPRRAYRGHHLANFFLRVLTALATGAAIVTILKSNQTVYVGANRLAAARARWNDFVSFRWFLLANAIVCAYSILAAIASLIGVCTRRGPLSSRPTAWLTFLFDFVLANALMSAAASGTTIAWIGYNGQPNANWLASCAVVKGFCRRVAGALIACYAGWVFLALATLVAVSALFSLRRRTAY